MANVTKEMLLDGLLILDASMKELLEQTSEIAAYARETNLMVAQGRRKIEETKLRCGFVASDSSNNR